MCTAATYQGKNFYFGRNLDYEFDYGQKVLVTGRNYLMHFNHVDDIKSHYAMIGMGITLGNLPQYFEGMNEKGLAMAGLNFVGNAYYNDEIVPGKTNLAQFELIPYVLASCESVKEVKKLITTLNLTSESLSKEMPTAQLHWMIADKSECIVMEATKTGIHLYENKVGVLTNNPPFDYQLFNLNNYMSLSISQPANNFDKNLSLSTYSRGMGAMGLPGDLSSMSRFVKVAFTRNNSKTRNSKYAEVSQFFHILTSVEQQFGYCEVRENEYEYTIYSSCCDCDDLIYYYTTYYNHQINAVDMKKSDMDCDKIIEYPFNDQENINYEN